MVPADSRRISRVPRYSGYHWALTSLHIRGSHPLWPDFPERSVRDSSAVAWSYYPDAALPQRRFGLFPGRSPLLGESLLFSLPRGTKMFQFPRFASSHNMMMTVLQTAGLSHSEIRGSKVICTLPRLIAAYHVLHRLREPRHPPCALIHFLGSAVSLCFKWTATHTFSYVHYIIYTSYTFLSFTLQFRVSTCQRSLYTLKTDVRSTGSLWGCLTNLRLSLSSLILVFSFFLFPPGITCGFGRVRVNAPERRCSSRTFRYGYLVTT